MTIIRTLAGFNRVLAKIKAPTLHEDELSAFSQPTYGGLEVREMPIVEAKAKGSSVDHLIIVSTVEKGSSAQKAGVLPGDILISLANQRVRDMASEQTISDQIKPGELVEGVFLRNGKNITLHGIAERAPLNMILMRAAQVQYNNHNYIRAKELADYLVHEEYPNAQQALGVIYYEGGPFPKDRRRAAELLEPPAKQGFITASYYLGLLYLFGNGVEKDEVRGVELIRYAADRGLPVAVYVLGMVYSDGRGVPKDLAKAKDLLELANAQGVPYAKPALDNLR